MLKNINPTTKIPSYITDFYVEYKGIDRLRTSINQSIVLKVGKVYYVQINREEGFKAIKILGGFLALDGTIGGCQMVYVYKTTKKEINATFSNQFVHVFATKEAYLEYAKTGKATYNDLCCDKIGFYNLWSVVAQVFPKTFETLVNVTSSNLYSYGGIMKRDFEFGDFKVYRYDKSAGKVVVSDKVGIEGLWIDENGEHLIWDESDIYNFYNSKEECFEAEFGGIDDDFGDDEEETENKTKPVQVNINVTINATDEESARKAIMEKLVGLI